MHAMDGWVQGLGDDYGSLCLARMLQPLPMTAR